MTIDSVEIVGDTANVNLSLTSGGGGLLGGGSYSRRCGCAWTAKTVSGGSPSRLSPT